MTKLQSLSKAPPRQEEDSSSILDSCGNLLEISQTEIPLDLRHDIGSISHLNTNSEIDNGRKSSNNDSINDTDDTTGESEPLGYQHFLCDVNIEYNLGGNRSSSGSHEHCFKMKRLPYMIGQIGLRSFSPSRNSSNSIQTNNDGGSSSDTSSNCNQNKYANDNNNGHIECNGDNMSDIQIYSSKLAREHRIDVTKATCAFLGNSDYAPNLSLKRRRVVLELVSAKLSQNNANPSLSANSNNMTNFINMTENSSLHNFDTTSTRSENSFDSRQQAASRSNYFGQERVRILSKEQASPVMASTSRKFVNYSILIRTVPGLDQHPAVIERRFSDFLALYQGLKSNRYYAKIVDKYVQFPKKVYMGNFTLAKIAERSIEFTRLLHLCMHNHNLMWSVPFASFLIDNELKEAHRLSLFGDPDDVQALVETVYYILKKIYLAEAGANGKTTSPYNGTSSCLSDLPTSCFTSTTTLPNQVDEPTMGIRTQQSPTGDASILGMRNNHLVAQNGNVHQRRASAVNVSLSPTPPPTTSSLAISGSNNGPTNLTSIGPINQRLLITYCMLFIVYWRSYSHHELKQAVQEFSQLISAQDFVDSLLTTRHYHSLRASLLFLMNLNEGDVIDENMRLWLKRKLEETDGAYAELIDDSSTAVNSDRTRITKKDLTSLLRERNFCTFQDNIK